jgi:tetratricopeptide (TPR) repeat protein
LRRDAAAAKKLAEEAGKSQPMLARPALLLARLADLADDPTTALKHYLEALERGDWSPRPLQRALRLLVAAGRYADADRLMERGQRRGALDAALTRPAAALALQAGRPERARELALAAVPGATRDYRDLVWVARVMEGAGQIGEAERCLQQAIELAPDGLEPWLSLIRLRRADRRLGPAREARDEMLKAVPAERRLLAEALGAEALGRLGDAVVALRRRWKEEPRDAEALRRLAELCVRLNKLDEAEAALKALLADDGPAQPEEVPSLRRTMALVLSAPEHGGRRAEDAARWLALNRVAEGDTAANRRAEALVFGMRPEDRSAALKELSAQPMTGGHQEQLRLATLFDAAGEWPRAHPILRRLATEDPDNPAYPALLIDGLLRNKKRPEATLWLGRLKELEPDSERVRRYEEQLKEE